MSRYSRTAITLHWLIAILLIGNLAGGFLLESVFDSEGSMGAMRPQIMQLHKSTGLTILLLSLARLGLRLTAGVPPLPSHMTGTEVALARITHIGFYVVMIGIPLSGWLMVSSSLRATPTLWFGLFEWPMLPVTRSAELRGIAGDVHEVLAFGAILLILLHVAGALKHHFWDRDDVLSRMIPALRRGR